MRRRKNLIVLLLAELAGVMLLVLLYLLFRIPPAPPGAAPTRVAAPTARHTAAPTNMAQAPTAPAAPGAPAAEASPTARVTLYTVVEGDTLWGIAVNFGLSLDELTAANPSIDPDRLYPGDVVNVPAPGAVIAGVTREPPQAPPAAAAAVSAQVAPGGDGLRLRRQPSTSADVITKLPGSTPLTLAGRTADNYWLEVVLSDGTRGWVMAQYVDVTGDLAQVIVTGADQTQPSTGSMSGASQLPPRDEPYISGISGKSMQIFQVGQAMGNHANVFALVGDSNTQNPAFLQPLDQGYYSLGDYGYLEDTVKFFHGSFARSQSSPAAVGGFNTTKVLDPANAGGGCNPGEMPLACEYRITRPSVALILLGTGDQHTWQGFEGRYRQIIEYTINQGVIPVLITKGDDLETRDNSAPLGYINGIIARLSREYDVPLLDLRQAVSNLPNRGFNGDGFHYNAPPDNKSCFFSGDSMRYGYTIRNLTALQMLDALRRQVVGG
jgi:LysM repeat protein